MRLAVIGRALPTSNKLIQSVLELWRPERVVVMRRKGLAAVAAELAEKSGIPVVSFPPDSRQVGEKAIEVAADQAAVVGQPDLLLAIAVDDRNDHRAIAVFRRRGIKVIVGNLEGCKPVEWAAV